MKKLLTFFVIGFVILASFLASYLILVDTEPSINFSSEVPNYSISLANQKALQALLAEWGTVGEENSVMPGIESIQVVLVTEEQPYGILRGDGVTVLQSHGQSMNDGLLTIFVYINAEEILSRESQESIAGRVTLQALWAIYNDSISVDDPERIQNIESFLSYLDGKELLLNPVVHVEKTN